MLSTDRLGTSHGSHLCEPLALYLRGLYSFYEYDSTCFQVPIILRAMQPVVKHLYHSMGCTACVQMPVVFWWAKRFVFLSKVKMYLSKSKTSPSK